MRDRLGLYRLDERGTPVACSVETWGKWFERCNKDRQVADTTVGRSFVSTVFLAIDHNHSGDGPPILWETMVFGGELDGSSWRYSSEEEAKKNHDRIVTEIKGHLRRNVWWRRLLLRLECWLNGYTKRGNQ